MSIKTHQSQRLLLIDAYDSFSNNLAALFITELHLEVDIVKIDNVIPKEDFLLLLSGYDGVIIGPGPGSPKNPKDIGIIPWIWELDEPHLLPVFGVCLGLQSLVYHFGGEIARLNEPTHGLIFEVSTSNQSIFKDVQPIHAVRYHSLHAITGHRSQSEDDLWLPSSTCPLILPLAWCLEDTSNAVLMAARHITKPFFAVQYHPESECTNLESRAVIRNWWAEAQSWSRSRGRVISQAPKTLPPGIAQLGPKGNKYDQKDLPQALSNGHQAADVTDNDNTATRYFHSEMVHLPDHITNIADTVTEICRAIHVNPDDIVLLDSAAKPGRYSILGLLQPGRTEYIQYQVEGNKCLVGTIGSSAEQKRMSCSDDVWSLLQSFMDDRKVEAGSSPTPFVGGLVGYISYEMGLEALQNLSHGTKPAFVSKLNGSHTTENGSSYSPNKRSAPPDINFVNVERSIVFDLLLRKAYVQSTMAGDDIWTASAATSLSLLFASSKSKSASLTLQERPIITSHIAASKSRYVADVELCRSHIRAGDSYELCLTSTDQFTCFDSTTVTDWDLFNSLRRYNPAPYAAFFKLGGTTVLSSSPERFLSWSPEGIAQFRPIKGTVRKSESIKTSDQARVILHSPKEKAENLMILDLIRHDLHGVVGAGRVHVQHQMKVEEYATVFHSVSVVEGTMLDNSILEQEDNKEPNHSLNNGYVKERSFTTDSNGAGIFLLKSSLPPGSMTGAPKLRSCEILQEIEKKARGVYSGVVGYISHHGFADFSVLIRTAWRFDSEEEIAFHKGKSTTKTPGSKSQPEMGLPNSEKPVIWNVGAGGAVTWLSEANAEYEERQDKLASTSRIFGNI
jgi:para-aminobenzoate synthetase